MSDRYPNIDRRHNIYTNLEGRVADVYAGIAVWYIAKPDLIANKRAVARLQDLADVEYLEKGPAD